MKLGVGIDTKPEVADENQRLEEINESVTARMTGIKVSAAKQTSIKFDAVERI